MTTRTQRDKRYSQGQNIWNRHPLSIKCQGCVRGVKWCSLTSQLFVACCASCLRCTFFFSVPTSCLLYYSVALSHEINCSLYALCRFLVWECPRLAISNCKIFRILIFKCILFPIVCMGNLSRHKCIIPFLCYAIRFHHWYYGISRIRLYKWEFKSDWGSSRLQCFYFYTHTWRYADWLFWMMSPLFQNEYCFSPFLSLINMFIVVSNTSSLLEFKQKIPVLLLESIFIKWIWILKP